MTLVIPVIDTDVAENDVALRITVKV